MVDQILSYACSRMDPAGRSAFVEFCCQHGANKFKLKQFNNDDANNVKISNLTGPNRRQILPLLCDVQNWTGIMSSRDEVLGIIETLRAFLEILNMFEVLSVDVPLLSRRVKRFVALFCLHTKKLEVPDYVHLLLHVPFLVQNFGNIKRFEQQAVERNNRFIERKYFAQTKCDVNEALRAANRAFLY